MIGFLFNLVLELFKLPFGILDRILKLPGTTMAVFGMLIIGSILIIVNHFQVEGGLKAPREIEDISKTGLNDVGIAGVVITALAALSLLKVLLELVWYTVSFPLRAYKTTYGSGYRKRSGRKSPKRKKLSPKSKGKRRSPTITPRDFKML